MVELTDHHGKIKLSDHLEYPLGSTLTLDWVHHIYDSLRPHSYPVSHHEDGIKQVKITDKDLPGKVLHVLIQVLATLRVL